MTPAIGVPTNNVAEHRFEVVIDGHRSVLVYHRDERRLVLAHTEVPDVLAGRGVGGALVAVAISEAESAGLTVVPSCPFAAAWLRRHPDAADRVTIEWPDAASEP